MVERIARIALVATMLSVGCEETQQPQPLPQAIEDFTRTALKGDIALKGGRFEPTDLISRGAARRRVISYRVEGSSAWLWYEHGGRVYHQHLVRFEVSPPHEIDESYVLADYRHKQIDELLRDHDFLQSSIAGSPEL